VRAKPKRAPLLKARRQAPLAFQRIRADTLAGMRFSNVIAVSIIITTAATLAVRVLAGSTAYAIGEGRRWPIGLSRQSKEAKAF
jgi:hypothetical protein